MDPLDQYDSTSDYEADASPSPSRMDDDQPTPGVEKRAAAEDNANDGDSPPSPPPPVLGAPFLSSNRKQTLSAVAKPLIKAPKKESPPSAKADDSKSPTSAKKPFSTSSESTGSPLPPMENAIQQKDSMEDDDEEEGTCRHPTMSMMPATRKLNQEDNDLLHQEDHELLHQREFWVDGIFPFLGKGHFIYVALVSRRHKEWYTGFCNEFHQGGYPMLNHNGEQIPCDDPIPMILVRNGEDVSGHAWKRLARPTDTFYSAAFSSLERAQFWHKIFIDHPQLLGHDDSLVFDEIARGGNWQVMQWAHQRGFQFSADVVDNLTTYLAAENGKLDVLMYAHTMGCQWDQRTCRYAAQHGHFQILIYAHQHGCQWNKRTCEYAARFGHLDCLEYAHENGCEWDEETCKAAVEMGHSKCLKYARKNCLEYARKNGCPWDEATRAAAAKRMGYHEFEE